MTQEQINKVIAWLESSAKSGNEKAESMAKELKKNTIITKDKKEIPFDIGMKSAFIQKNIHQNILRKIIF